MRSIIDVAHALHMRVVAEGVEQEAEREKLRSLGCDLLQGYLLARPMPREAMARLLQEHRRVGGEQGAPGALTSPATSA